MKKTVLILLTITAISIFLAAVTYITSQYSTPSPDVRPDTTTTFPTQPVDVQRNIDRDNIENTDTCTTDEDCGPINCLQAPCPEHRCIAGACVEVYE